MYYAPTIVRWHIFLFMERWIDATYIRYIVSILHHLFFLVVCHRVTKSLILRFSSHRLLRCLISPYI